MARKPKVADHGQGVQLPAPRVAVRSKADKVSMTITGNPAAKGRFAGHMLPDGRAVVLAGFDVRGGLTGWPVLTVQNVGNPDMFADHVAACLNLNANYSASLLPIVRLLLDYQDGNRTAEQGRAYWRELRRYVAHHDAVTGKEPCE